MSDDKKKSLLFCGKTAAAVFFALLHIGCSTVENPSYDAVAAHLDAGGCYYRISDGSGFYRTVGNLAKTIKLSLYENSGVSQEEKESFLLKAGVFEYLVKISGIAECRWSGESSVRLPDVLEPLYRNRHFFLLPDEHSGILWSLPGRENRPLFKELADLPADTVAAGDFVLDLRRPGSELAGNKELDAWCRQVFRIGIRELCTGISGEWGFALFHSPVDGTVSDFVFTFPDRKGKIFGELCRYKGVLPLLKEINSTTVALKISPDREPVIISGEAERIVVYSNKRTMEHFVSVGTKLARQPEFQRLSTGMPSEGLAIFYYAGVKPETRELQLQLKKWAVNLDPSDWEQPELTVIRREKNGISVVAQSGVDLPTGMFLNYLVSPGVELLKNKRFIQELLPGFFEKKTGQAERTEQKIIAPEKGSADISGCKKNIEKISGALTAWAKKNAGSYPEEMDIAGLRKLVSAGLLDAADFSCPGSLETVPLKGKSLEPGGCSYLYFGAWKKNSHKKLPLLIDHFGNHKDQFHVIYNDGTFELIRLENCVNVKRIAGFLHTKFSYDEEEFQELILRASKFDSALDAQ